MPSLWACLHQLPKHHIILVWLRVPSESKILKVLFHNFELMNHMKSWSLFILLRNEEVVASYQQMETTWVNQLSLLIQNDINEILKPVKNNKKFIIYINHYFIHTHKYNSEIFHLLKQKIWLGINLKISWSKQSTS